MEFGKWESPRQFFDGAGFDFCAGGLSLAFGFDGFLDSGLFFLFLFLEFVADEF
jgi:hypothetical protein